MPQCRNTQAMSLVIRPEMKPHLGRYSRCIRIVFYGPLLKRGHPVAAQSMFNGRGVQVPLEKKP